MDSERDQNGRFRKGRKHPLKPAKEIQQISDAMHNKKYKYLDRKSSNTKYGIFECLV